MSYLNGLENSIGIQNEPMFTSICKIKLSYFNLHKVISLLRDCFYTAETIPKVKFLLINIFFLIGLEGGGGGVEDTRVPTCTKKIVATVNPPIPGSRQQQHASSQVARPWSPRCIRGVAFRTGPGPRTPTDSQPSYTHMGPARSGLANGLRSIKAWSHTSMG